VVRLSLNSSIVLYFTLKTGRAEFDMSKTDSPFFVIVIISSGEFPAPISAIVRPFTWVPGFNSSNGKSTSGVHVKLATKYFLPPISEVVNVLIGA
jgi:hypothetical protein